MDGGGRGRGGGRGAQEVRGDSSATANEVLTWTDGQLLRAEMKSEELRRCVSPASRCLTASSSARGRGSGHIMRAEYVMEPRSLPEWIHYMFLRAEMEGWGEERGGGGLGQTQQARQRRRPDEGRH